MDKVDAQPLMRSLIIVAAFAVAFSSFTLWLIDSWIETPLFIFEILAILVLYMIVRGHDVKLHVKHFNVKNVHIGPAIDVFFVISASTLLIIDILHIQGGVVQLILALLSTSILSGHALLNTLGLARHFSRLETIVLSYLLSYAFTGFVALASLVIDEGSRTILTLCAFIALGSISAFKHKSPASLTPPRSFSKGIDFVAISLTIAFYVLAFLFMYPGFASLSADTLRHYASSVVLIRAPDLYMGSGYLLANLHESMILLLSSTSLIYAQSALLTLNFMLPLAFFTMARPYLERIDVRLPSSATIFWVLFTNGFGGFAWLYFANLRLSTLGQTQLQLLATAADKTYNGTIYGLLGLWYVPATVSIVVLMTAVFLMCKKEIPTSTFVPLFSAMIVALYLTHVTEAVIFAIFLAIYGAISRNETLRIDDSMKSSIAGFLIVAIVYYIFSLFTARFIFDLPQTFALAIPISALLLSLVFRKFFRQRLHLSQIRSRITGNALLKTLLLSLLFLYTVSFLSWVMITQSFSTWQFDTIGLVPWFMYPMMLGLNGLLAIFALYCLVGKMKPFGLLMLFIAFMIFAFVVGKLVSIANIYLFDVGYWEKRFIWFIKIPLAILAPIPIILAIDELKKRVFRVSIKTVASSAMIGAIVLCGMSTTFLNLEYWNIVANNPANQPSSNEMSAINAFTEILDNDPKAWLATVTETSANTATFAAPADMLVLKPLLYSANTPEMAYTQLYRHPAYTHPYVYIDDRDGKQLENGYEDCFLAKYLNTIPLVFNNSEVKIYNASKPSLPQLCSDNALLIPLDKFLYQENLRDAYEILSQGFFNYTVSYDLDNNALDARTIILPFDPVEAKVLAGVFHEEFDQTLESWTVSNGIWRIEDGWLAGGESGQYGEGIILSPVSAENFTSTFKAKPKSGDTNALNYADLVYSWTDLLNYRIAEVLFNSDGYVYVLFRSFVDGAERTFPEWPGVKTDLRWDFNSELEVRVNVSGRLNEISINGKTYISSDLGRASGRIGLRYNRFYAVSFDNLDISYAAEVNLRPVEDYLNYLDLGGRIILLNTNGYGFFANNLFFLSNSTFNAQRIQGSNLQQNLPQEVSVPILSYKNSSTTTVSSYTAISYETSFISHQDYGSGELFYVNVCPIVKAMHENNPSTFYELLGKLLDDLTLTKLDPNTKLTFDAYVKAVYLSNGVQIETDSILFSQECEFERIDVEAGNRSYVFYNVTALSVKQDLGLVIETDSTSTQNGEGFYARFQMNSAFSVKPKEGSFALKIAADGVNSELGDVNLLSVRDGNPVELLARTPMTRAFEATFVEFYPQGNLQSQTRTYGQNLKATGLTEFSIMLSDTYSVVTDIKLATSLERSPPIVTFDLLSTLPTAIFWFLILLPAFLGSFFIFKIRERHRNRKSVNNQGEMRQTSLAVYEQTSLAVYKKKDQNNVSGTDG